MNQLKRWLSYIFRHLLILFPQEFRADHEEEIQSVFDLELEEAANKGLIHILRRAIHELVDIPGAVVRQHLRQRRKRILDRNTLSDESISGRRLLIGLGLFLLSLIFELDYFNHFPIFLGLLAFPVIVSLAGIYKGFPRWTFPSLGVAFAALLLISFREVNLIWIRDRLVTSQNELSRYFYAAFSDGIFWISLVILTTVLFFFLAALPRYRPFSQRLKQDWTLISFTMYGALLAILLTSWDNYRHLEPYRISALVFLTVGAWGYLRSEAARERIISLIAGAALAMMTLAIGKWILVPLQNWPVWFTWHPSGTERWFESLGTLMELGWIMIALIFPASMGIFRKKFGEHSKSSPKFVP